MSIIQAISLLALSAVVLLCSLTIAGGWLIIAYDLIRYDEDAPAAAGVLPAIKHAWANSDEMDKTVVSAAAVLVVLSLHNLYVAVGHLVS